MLCCYTLASVTARDEIELIAVVGNGGLSWGRGGDAVAGCGGRRLMADDGYTSVSISPQSGARSTHAGVPRFELILRDPVERSNHLAGLAGRDKVESVTVVNNGGLRGGRRGDTISGLRGCYWGSDSR